ncbi:phage late control D family protein [Serratia ureilytica]|uniref:Phage late control D family protein n=1 Tax=Serratia ureilytica TaxID=300181 RepID=A0A9X9BZV4_9GAMM|nr:phage late control D family protein [Serratia ureilytica]TXE26943.1 phage late control D family protein [Serratia ureilytica]
MSYRSDAIDRLTGQAKTTLAFAISIDEKDITQKLEDRLISMTITDNRGFEADMLDICLNDTDGKLQLPRRGAVLTVSLGWKGAPLTPKGSYVVDEIEYTGAPDQLSIRARSADFRASLNLMREQSWHNTTLGAIIQTIADRNKLKANLASDIAKLAVHHSDQANESDGNYLIRIADHYGLVASIKNNTLILLKPGNSTTASGKPIPPVVITRKAGDSHSFSVADRDAYTGVIAHYLDTQAAERQKVHVKRKRKTGKTTWAPDGKLIGDNTQGDYLIGSDENVKVLRHTYANKYNATRAADSAWRKIQRGVASFSITLAIGQAAITPEFPVKVSGFKKEIDAADWTIKQVTHTLTDAGFTTALELEVKVSDLDME